MINSPRLQKIQQLLSARGEPPYRYKQICAAVFGRALRRYDDITELSKDLRQTLIAELGEEVLSLRPAQTRTSPEADKLLFELADSARIEAVFLRSAKNDTTLCISTQVGCDCACDFCATGAVGFSRNLSADEIVDQVLFFMQQNHRPKGVSLMGMGEPLLNPHTFDALEMLTDKNLFNIGQRSINLSTVGVPSGIARLTNHFPQINIAFSLHSPFSEERSRLVPLNKKYPLHEVLNSLDRHIEKTHRKVFIVYALFDGINDTPAHARALSKLLQRGEQSRLYHVNLMRYNPHRGAAHTYRTTAANLRHFRGLLENDNLKVTLRHSPGIQIEAACGQLYANYPAQTAPSGERHDKPK